MNNWLGILKHQADLAPDFSDVFRIDRQATYFHGALAR
jgi:hypothetical protein